MECSNEVALELLKGKTVNNAITKSHNKSTKVMADLIYSEDPYAYPVLAALIHNDSALGFEGDPSARIA